MSIEIQNAFCLTKGAFTHRARAVNAGHFRRRDLGRRGAWRDDL
jgi:hypothetical protein